MAPFALLFEPADLVGKRVVVVCNLPPQVYSEELTSRGVILVAGRGAQRALVTVPAEIPPGSRVK